MANTYRHTADFAPYYDDWESAQHDDKGYVKVLFKPSVAVQARELNQTQTYLNNQIASLGGYLFKDGTPVSGAKISYVTNQKYAIASISYDSQYSFDEIKEAILDINRIDKEDSSSSLSAHTLRGIETTQVVENNSTATVVSDTSETTGVTIITRTTDPVIQITGFYEYENPSNSDDEDNIAVLNSAIGRTVVKRVVVIFNLYGGQFDENKSYTFTMPDGICSIVFNKVGTCTTASCTKGIIFVDGYFINVPMSTVLVNPFNKLDINYPLALFDIKDISNDDVQYNVGFWIERDIVTAYEDTTLVDPASGSYNYKAPGADRYKIIGKLCCITDEKLASELEKYEADESVKFVTGIVLKNNVLIKEQNNVGTNSDLMDEMARRTYEESGNYAVNPWKVQIEEHPTDPTLYGVSIEPGLGYIYGYRVSNVVSQKFENEKSRKTLLKAGNSKSTDASRYTITEDLYSDDVEAYEFDSRRKNLHSINLDNVINSDRCLLLDRSISELLKIRDSQQQNQTTGQYNLINIIDPIDLINGMSYPVESGKENKNIIYDENIVAHVVGEVTISNVISNGDGSLILYTNNFNNTGIVYELSNAYSIVSISKPTNTDSTSSTNDDTTTNKSIDYKITGYVDLKIDDTSMKSIWKNNESPYIFETDYSFVANTIDAHRDFRLSYRSVLRAKSTAYDTNTGRIVFGTFLDYPIPAEDKSTIVCLIDSKGKIYPSSEYVKDDDDTSASFAIKLLANLPVDNQTTFTIYYTATLTNNTGGTNTSNQFLKYKTLKIKECTFTTDSIYFDSVNDCLQLDDYDLVTLLSVKFSSKTTEDDTQVTSSNADVQEILYEGDNSLTLSQYANLIKLDTQVTDVCYKKSRIYGLQKVINERKGTHDDNTSNTNEPSTIIITYAYYEHSSHDSGFYCALSYNVDPSLIVKTNLSIMTQRLYEYFNISGIYESSTELSFATSNDSSSNRAGDGYKLIPIYKSITGSQYNLADCIDFRQDYDENGKFFPVNPLPSSTVTYNLSIYLPRIDNVWIDKTGNFGITKGIPAENPVPPAEIDGAMVIYRLYNRPYSKSIDDIIPTYIDNRRHTMKDISKLTERVTALEEVVSMSLIEQSAVNLQITDDDGITRYKCGIFTDTFSNFNNCNINDEEWSASIDSVEKSIRPYFTEVDWSLSPIGEYTSPNKEGSDIVSINGYKLVVNTNTGLPKLYDIDSSNELTGVACWNNSVITLKPIDLRKSRDEKLTYTNSSDTAPSAWNYPSNYSYVYAKNINCTETTNVQSLMFATWSGNLTLFPAIDTWINDLGDIIVNTTYENTEKPATVYRSWTTTSTSTFDTTETTTVASGLSVADIKKLYGSDKAATQAGKLHQRVVAKGTKVANGGNGVGHWEPAETTTTIRSYETTTTTTVTEKTAYTGSYIANDVATYMEEQDAFMRVRFVEFTLKGMRPNSKMKATMDGVELKLLKVEDYNTAGLTPEEVNNKKNEYKTIETDSNGDANGYIVVPNKMPVGTKVVQFFDGEKLATCHADYTANGKTVWNNIDRTYIRQWTPVTSQTSKSNSSTVFTGASRTITATEIFKEEDPIAESFYISQENGIMLEAIDIFFAAKDASIGVELFIVECENGYPGQTIVPFSRVFVSASDVKITEKKTIEKSAVKALPKPTTFKFPVPIYLHPKQEYAFIVIAPSYNYEIYTSTLGKVDLVTGKEIKEQPYTGSMFKSQNLRTWTAEQEQDIMFVMYSMKFNTNSDGFPVYFGLDDMMAKRTGLVSTLPDYIDNTQNMYDMMNLSAGTFMPNMTDIAFQYKISPVDSANTTEWTPYSNKQDIFLDFATYLSSNTNTHTGTAEDNSGSSEPSATFINRNSSLNVMATLSTGDPNVTPQIDIEDFHGIFARNVISKSSTLFDGHPYFKAGSYISNSILLKEPAIGLKVIMDAILPGDSLIKTYYKLTNVASKYYTMVPNVNASVFMNQTVLNNNSSIPENTDNSTSSNEQYVLKDKITTQIGLYASKLENTILNKLCYVWYHVFDNVDKRYKFICPTQLYSNSTEYVPPSFVPTKGNVLNEGTEIIINNSNNSEVFKDGIIEDTEINNTNYKTFSYYRNNDNNLDNPNYQLIGIYAIPDNSAMYTPSEVIGEKKNNTIVYTTKMSNILQKQYMTVTNSTNQETEDSTSTVSYIDYYFKTITCCDYDPSYKYLPGEMCIYQNILYINNSITNIKGIAPVSSVTNNGWVEIPCVLLTKSYTQKIDDNAVWIEMQGNEYKKTTERQTNFMEYTYSTIESSTDTNYFDEFTLKIELYCQDQCNVPRFRNLRAIAVV